MRSSLAGMKFGRLTAITPIGPDCRGGFSWVCRCECGKEKTVARSNLTTGHTRSCGCLSVETARKSNMTHGHSGKGGVSREYNTWQSMFNRCRNKKAGNYKYYGGRGIDVCDRWNSFENFLSDMGERPPGTTLERKDGDGNYEPSNCVWATRHEQMKNRSNSIFIELGGIRLTVADWSRRLRLNRTTITSRMKRGLSTPYILRPFSMKCWAELEGGQR